MHVLVVEDDSTVRRLLGLALADLGRIQIVDNHRDAADAVLRERPDVVVLDVMLQGRSGLTLLSHWRNDPVFSDLPVVLLTALDDSMERRAGVEAGADAYITKPFEPRELVELLQTIVDSGGRRNPRILDRSPQD